MKQFFISTSTLGVIASIVFYFIFDYPISTSFFHALIILSTASVVSLIIFIIRICIRPPVISFLISNTILFIYWAYLLVFYPLAIGSNYFWGNTITLKISQKYLRGINEVISILPIERWILHCLLTLYFLLIIITFYLIRIRLSKFEKGSVYNLKQKTYRFRWVLASSLLLILILYKPMLNLKRAMHFKMEPLIFFTLGPIWGDNWTNESIFQNKTMRMSFNEENCIREAERHDTSRRRVIIILFDALRNDHLSLYGYNRTTTPFLDSIYQTGSLVRIKHAFSTSTNTTGGIINLFYSKDWGGFGYADLTLMKFFRIKGYKTSAILTGYHSGWYGLSTIYRQDTDDFFESSSNHDKLSDDDLETLEKINSHHFSPGTFTFMHLLSTHAIGKKSDEFKRFLPDKIGLNVSRQKALVNNYDNGVLQADYMIRKIFEKLKKDDALKNTTIIITSDHGDLLGEGGEYGHAKDIHEKVINIPILIYDDDPTWYKNKEIATIKDIAPTITDRLFGQTPSCWQGRSLGNPLENFSTSLISPNKCDLPRGELSYKNDSIHLKIFNNQGELHSNSLLDTLRIPPIR